MAEMTELERVEQAQTYISRYHEFEDAITINKENRAYLKTYIHDEAYVEKEFNLKSQRIRSIGLSLGAGVLVFALLTALLGTDLIIASAICGGVAFILLAVFGVCLQHFRLTEAKKQQVEVNEGIEEQLQILTDRDAQLIRQRDDYYKGLEKRITFMSLDYMKNIDQIKSYIESGEAATCEEAVEILERNMLLQEMTSLTSKVDMPAPVNHEAAKERLGDPLELIKKNKKKKKKLKSVKNGDQETA